MGNPAGVEKKKREKRRLRFEARLGPAAYLPKEIRDQVNAQLAKVAAADPAAKAEKAAKAVKK
jgi:hypothetical protein